MDTLQDEMLHKILSSVPPSDLLALRLVCKRWSEVIVARPVWQNRHLIGRNYAYKDVPLGWVNTGLLCTVVRLVPALRRLSLILQPGSKAGLPAARALARGICQVRSLELSVQLLSKRGTTLNYGAMAALRSMLQGLPLEELKLDIYVFDGANQTSAAQRVVSKKIRQILGWVSKLPVVKLKFSLNCGRSQSWDHHFHDDCINGEVTGLTALRELHIANRFCCGPSLSSIRNLLARNTLQIVRADRDIGPVLSGLPRNLKELHIPTTADWGFLLQCENLDVLTVFARRHSRDGQTALGSLDRLLSSPRLPREVRVVVTSYHVSTLLTHTAFLGQVRHLELQHCPYQTHTQWIRLLQALATVTDLRLDSTFEPLLPVALFWWPEDAVPELARLTVPHGTWQHWRRDVDHVRAVLYRLSTSRPRLVVKTYSQ